MHVLVLGSQYWPAGQFNGGDADPTAGCMIAHPVSSAITKETVVTTLQKMLLIAHLRYPNPILCPDSLGRE